MEKRELTIIFFIVDVYQNLPLTCTNEERTTIITPMTFRILFLGTFNFEKGLVTEMEQHYRWRDFRCHRRYCLPTRRCDSGCSWYTIT